MIDIVPVDIPLKNSFSSGGNNKNGDVDDIASHLTVSVMKDWTIAVT